MFALNHLGRRFACDLAVWAAKAIEFPYALFVALC